MNLFQRKTHRKQGELRPTGVQGSIPVIVIGLVAVISSIFGGLLKSGCFTKKEKTPMKLKSMSVRTCFGSLLECISAIATIAVGDALST